MRPPDVVLSEAIELIEQIKEVSARAYAKSAASIYSNPETQLLCMDVAKEYMQIALACDKWIKTGTVDPIEVRPSHTAYITEDKNTLP